MSSPLFEAYIAVATFETQQNVIAVADTTGGTICTTTCTTTAVSSQQAVSVADIQIDSSCGEILCQWPLRKDLQSHRLLFGETRISTHTVTIGYIGRDHSLFQSAKFQ